MKSLLRIATAFAAGAFAMYYMDPEDGRRRRALVRDRGIAAGHDAEHLARGKSRHARDHMRGMMARTREHLSRAPIDDDQLHDRIRARLGRLVGHSGEVKVDVHEGQVVLRGSAPAREIEDLVQTLASMRGVREIDNRLTADGTTGDLSRH